MSRLLDRSPANWRAYDSAAGWIAVLLALLLAILWFIGRGPNAAGCCSAPTSATAATAVTAAVAGSVKTAAPVVADGGLSWGEDGKVTLTGTVKDDAAKRAIVAAAVARYGASNVVDQLKIDANAATKVVLTGIVASESEKKARGDWAASLYGSGVVIDNQLLVRAPVAVIAKPPNVRVYFDSKMTNIDDKDRLAIAPVLAYLTTNPTAKAVISGFHDPRGKKEMNEALAKARATSVRDVLIAAGIAEARIDLRKPQETTGSGDNAEARRVELSVE